MTIACTDTEFVEVEVERQLFNDPPDQQFLFLGYFDADDKLTTCGNCHVGQQAGWEQTGHADAWDDLQASGGAAEYCYGCHAISQYGNALDEDAGYLLVEDEAYQDVQCESCHGSGWEHVENPDASQPLASAKVGTDLTNGCGDCHSGEVHNPFVNEWEQSPHAVSFGGSNDPNCGEDDCAAGRVGSSCRNCHRGQQVLQRFGENADYIEKFADEHLPVACGVCHDPHERNYEHQLRFPVRTEGNIENHLCAQCHNRRSEPSATSSHGLHPHSPESALLVGDAGWFAPGADIDQGQIRATHGSDRNPELCATCHVSAYNVVDEASGNITFFGTGHLFRPIPCLDETTGKPLPFGNDCALTEPEGVDARTWDACIDLGCHADAGVAWSALKTRVDLVQGFVDELHELLLCVDPNLDEAGGAIDPYVSTFTSAEGAFFNMELAEFGNEEFGTNTVVGSSVHNPFLITALLTASIDAVLEDYPACAPVVSATDYKAELQKVLQQVPGR